MLNNSSGALLIPSLVGLRMQSAVDAAEQQMDQSMQKLASSKETLAVCKRRERAVLMSMNSMAIQTGTGDGYLSSMKVT